MLTRSRGLLAHFLLIYTAVYFKSEFISGLAFCSYAQAHVSTQPSSPLENARISDAHENQERPGRAFAPAC
jgi:hypothetical protein